MSIERLQSHYLLTELRHAFSQGWTLTSFVAIVATMINHGSRDLAGLSVPLLGTLQDDDRSGGCRSGCSTRRASRWRRCRHISGTCRRQDGRRRRCARMGWICCAGFDSCGAIGVEWNRATRVEARDFSRWMLLAGKPSRPHWRHPDEPAPPAEGAAVCRVRAGAFGDGVALLLRLPPRPRRRADREPVPVGSVPARWPGARAPQSDGALPQRAHRAVSAEGPITDSTGRR